LNEENSKIIEEFTQAHLENSKLTPRGPKVIHETIWGTNLYYPWEIALLNTSLLQRLRLIHQTGLGYFTFPTATHTRFDHSLGVCIKSGQFANKLLEKIPGIADFSNDDIYELRISALLHDIGHCLFSHTSEEVYSLLPSVQGLIGQHGEYEGAAAHEALSCLIIKTKIFSDFFDKLKEQYSKINNCKIENIQKYILGKFDSKIKYKSDFLNGPFDSDKIDYLFRDGHFSGIPINIDIDRMAYAINRYEIQDNGNNWQRLVLDHTGISPVEQILFNKIQLYPILYHHHKVKAADCMFKGIVEHIQTGSSELIMNRNNDKLKFDKIRDYLWTTESQIFTFGMNYDQGNKIHTLIHDLQYRRLIKRVAAISPNTVILNDSFRKFVALRHPNNKDIHDKLRNIAKIISLEASKKYDCPQEQVWIELPISPKIGKDIRGAYILYPNNIVKVVDIFPIEDWLESYELYKWQAYVFGPDGLQDQLAPIVKDVLKSELGLSLKDEAFTCCHVKAPK
jgi:HD superfamily phosphohydrolase